MKLSVPADFKCSTLKSYGDINEQYADKVIETYGQLNNSNNFLGSGRAWNALPFVDMDQLNRYVDASNKLGIGFNYVLNATCLSNREFEEEGMRSIYSLLQELWNIGVYSLTIALPSVIEMVKMSGMPFQIKASTVSCITNADKAMSYRKLGVERIVTDESINRNFREIKKIRSRFGEKVELIVNVVCYKNCIYRMYHHNQMSHDYGYSKDYSTYYTNRCVLKRLEQPENLLKMCFIRPEDIHYYEKIGIEYFKIQGRQAAENGDIPRAVKCYMERSYKGNLLDLLDGFLPTNSFRIMMDNSKLNGFIEPFYSGFSCVNDCKDCSYCATYFRENFSYDEACEISVLGKQFYTTVDDYKNKMNAVISNKLHNGGELNKQDR